MPYTGAQCAAFAVKAERGEDVPADWRKHCKGVKQSKKSKHKSKKTRATHNHGG